VDFRLKISEYFVEKRVGYLFVHLVIFQEV
jgi:hypothetical protein